VEAQRGNGHSVQAPRGEATAPNDRRSHNNSRVDCSFSLLPRTRKWSRLTTLSPLHLVRCSPPLPHSPVTICHIPNYPFWLIGLRSVPYSPWLSWLIQSNYYVHPASFYPLTSPTPSRHSDQLIPIRLLPHTPASPPAEISVFPISHHRTPIRVRLGPGPHAYRDLTAVTLILLPLIPRGIPNPLSPLLPR
jgi:hypothetical protein